MHYLVFDLVIAAALLLCVWQGYRRGFILTLCGFLAVFVAFFGAGIVSSLMAEPISQLLRPLIERSLTQSAQDSLTSSALVQASAQSGDLLSSLPLEQALELLRSSGLYQAFSAMVESAVAQGILAATTNAVRSIADYISLQAAKLVLFIIAFVLILILWTLLSRALDLAFRLPVLSTLNHWSGAALGLLKGAVVVYIAVWLLRDSLIPPEAVQQTYLLKFFSTTTPAALFAGFLQAK